MKGIIPSLNTPFSKKGNLDHNSLAKLVEHTIKSGCNGMLGLAVAGEGESLSFEEKVGFIDSVRLALKEVVGADGIVGMNKDIPGTLIAARNGSPLIVGLSEDEKFVSSDVSAVLEYTRNILEILPDFL